MKILEYMSFNPSWFTTLPGVLITGGVVVLLIALIVLLTSGGSKKEEGSIESASSTGFESAPQPEAAVPCARAVPRDCPDRLLHAP